EASPARIGDSAGDEAGGAGCEIDQACELPYIEAQFCHPSPGIWIAHSNHSGIVGSQRCSNDDDLYARSESRWPWSAEPFRQFVARRFPGTSTTNAAAYL